MRKISLDTNTYKAIAQNDSSIISIVEDADKVFISFVVYAELLYGFKYGSRYTANVKVFSAFLSNPMVEVTQSTMDTIEIYADLSKHLRSIGRPIPTNDIWIAASTIEVGSILVTNDAHFEEIQGLRLLIP